MTPVREALKTAISHIEHMSAWIAKQNAGYSFESIGEDMPGLLAALSAAPGEPCAVKPLEWSNNPPPAHEDNPFSHWAAGIGGHYHAEHDGMLWMAHDGFVWEKYETQEAAKAAAQADHEQRIRSALVVTTPQPAAGWDGGRDHD